jgi:hypothetical protein
VVTQNYQFYGGQTTSFFINKILLPDSNSLQLRTFRFTFILKSNGFRKLTVKEIALWKANAGLIKIEYLL